MIYKSKVHNHPEKPTGGGTKKEPIPSPTPAGANPEEGEEDNHPEKPTGGGN